jgi:hypothetical protein
MLRNFGLKFVSPVKQFWALCDNIYDVCVVIIIAMVMLLKDFGLYDHACLLP